MTATVDLDEDNLGPVSASGGGQAMHSADWGILDRSWAAIQLPPPLRHRRRSHDVAVPTTAEHRATVKRHDRIGGPMYFEHGHRSRRGTRKGGAQRPGNRRDGGACGAL